jgi:hypothetical protein
MKNFKKGFVYFSDVENDNYIALIEPNNYWNGWEMPYIHVNDLPKFIKMVNNGGMDETTMKHENDVLNVVQYEDGEIVCTFDITPMVFNNEVYYYVGGLGLCFEFSETDKIENGDVRCNNCYWVGYDNNLDLIKIEDEFVKVCPNCQTDDFLMDI